MQYAMWALGRSIDPNTPGVANLLRICSRPLGVVAIAVSMLLPLAALSMLADRLRDFRKTAP